MDDYFDLFDGVLVDFFVQSVQNLITVCCKGKGRQLAKSREKEVNERALQLLDAMSTVQRGGMSGTLSAYHPTSVKIYCLGIMNVSFIRTIRTS